jgi:hypothetical protein
VFTRETQLAAAEPCAWNTPAGRRHGGSQQRPRSFAMDDLEAAATLKSLATGLDPGTGAPLAAALASLATPDVVRALYLAADSLEARQRLVRRQSSLPRNAGKPWSADEDERLLTAFDAGAGVDSLVAAHERTRAGIEARLVKHGRLEPDQAPAARIR